MTFIELARSRYSLRAYLSVPVPAEMIDRCVQAAQLAPSACNSQPWKFIVVDDPARKEELAQAAFKGLVKFNHFTFQAPVLVVIVSQRQKQLAKIAGIVKKRDFSLMDIGIAAEHFCLQAAEEGLGTCMLGWFNEKKVKELLSVPTSKRVELIISVGFAAETDIPPKNRKPLDEILSRNQY